MKRLSILLLSIGSFMHTPGCLADTAPAESTNSTEQSATSAIAPDNYLGLVTPEGPHRWPLDRMPIRVYLAPGQGIADYRPVMAESMRNAFEKWSSSLDGRVRFEFVDQPKDADIQCTWTSATDQIGGKDRGAETITSVQRDGTIQTVSIKTLTHLPSGAPLPDNVIDNISLHEVGHALGLRGHSPDNSDVMAPSTNDSQNRSITARDRNTMRMLYFTPTDDLMKTVIALQAKALGAGNPELGKCVAAYAQYQFQEGKFPQSAATFQNALNLEESTKHPDELSLSRILNGIGVSLCRQGKLSEAAPPLTRAAEIQKRLLDPHSKELAITLANLAATRLVSTKQAPAPSKVVPLDAGFSKMMHSRANSALDSLPPAPSEPKRRRGAGAP